MSDETGKCTKAKQRLGAIEKRIAAVKAHMITAYNSLQSMVHPKKPKVAAKADMADLVRIDLPKHGIDLYIDFCLMSDDDDIEGAIVYGALRKPQFPDAFWPNADEKDKWEARPLACFAVSDLGEVTIKGKLDDEWWLSDTADKKSVSDKQREKIVKELHYRALDLIWRDALNWVNEPLLP